MSNNVAVGKRKGTACCIMHIHTIWSFKAAMCLSLHLFDMPIFAQTRAADTSADALVRKLTTAQQVMRTCMHEVQKNTDHSSLTIDTDSSYTTRAAQGAYTFWSHIHRMS